jgi:catechol 2,3-dioxygenase-like lactoylglutathione lyase family enzyme
MAVHLNHTIAHAHDAAASATFLSEMLGVASPTRFGPFHVVEVDNGVSIDFLDVDADYEIEVAHYAFLVTDEEWDQIFGRIQERELPYWADPHNHEAGQINHHDGGRGVYWRDPDGHMLEIITVPYGGWPSG